MELTTEMKRKKNKSGFCIKLNERESAVYFAWKLMKTGLVMIEKGKSATFISREFGEIDFKNHTKAVKEFCKNVAEQTKKEKSK